MAANSKLFWKYALSAVLRLYFCRSQSAVEHHDADSQWLDLLKTMVLIFCLLVLIRRSFPEIKILSDFGSPKMAFQSSSMGRKLSGTVTDENWLVSNFVGADESYSDFSRLW